MRKVVLVAAGSVLGVLVLMVTIGAALPTKAAQEPDAPLSPDRPFLDDAEYVERMKAIDHAFEAVSVHRDHEDVRAVEGECVELARLFGRVESFWKARGDEERAGFARLAKDGATNAREAARRGERESLDDAILTIAASCRGCHREPLDKYRIETP